MYIAQCSKQLNTVRVHQIPVANTQNTQHVTFTPHYVKQHGCSSNVQVLQKIFLDGIWTHILSHFKYVLKMKGNMGRNSNQKYFMQNLHVA
jgi:hypothetical protein